jgi:tetratricopeptide (TPR) repeat protein
MNNQNRVLTPSKTLVTENLPGDNPAGKSVLRTPRFFRKVDWLSFAITLCCVWIGYYLTLAPELTLEDSGELATGSFYAGIPHPPGYPVWTIYTWLWTFVLPVKNVAWRVALGEATSGALAAALLALLVSRGGSLLIEGIQELKLLPAQTENAICLVAGFVAGMLLGFNGFMWSQSVIVEVYSFSVASLMAVLLCLLRWIYAPQQRRFLYLALFFHGICFTNHQTLIVAAMGIEVAIAAASFRMGRYLFLGNGIIYIGGLILKQQHILTALDQNQAIFVIFNVVGIASIACYCWFTILSKETAQEFRLDASLAGFFIFLTLMPGLGWLPGLLASGALGLLIWSAMKTRELGWEWLVVIGCGCCWILGAAFYFYMPLAGMTNPPMEWGYPRTVEGFIHAFTRGQYEKTHPTDIIHDPLRFITQLSMLGDGIIEEFNWVYALIALVPFVFFFKLHKRERAWLTGITAIYLCLGVLLLILLNPPPDRAAQQLVRVFFTASHTIIALLVGYGIALSAAYLATHYQSFRHWGLTGGAVAAALAVFSFAELTSRTFFGENVSVAPIRLLSFVGQTFTDPHQFGLPVYAGLILIAMALAFVGAVWCSHEHPPTKLALVIFALMPLHSILTHWADNEQRNHWFGYYFGHDMFKPPFERADHKPLYPEMAKEAVLFGGTDPGRFCPTYMIFCDSFIPHRCQPPADRNFDRRDVYIITQNALADGTYLEYIRAQYNRSTQVDPPFFQELLRSDEERRANIKTNFLARFVQPLDHYFEGLGDRIEKRRRTFTSWFKPSDFLGLSAFAARLRPRQNRDALSQYIYGQLKSATQQELGSPEAQRQTLLHNLCRDLNELLDGGPLYNPERFQNVHLSEYLQDFVQQNPQSHSRIRLNRLLLEAAYPGELAKSAGGVYPDREIYTPTADDSVESFNEYAIDAQRRMRLNRLKPGEDIIRQGDRVQISGPSAVMGINGLLTKVIFDHNPKNEFYVEESFPLDWMYPHLTPYGIIMKINHQPLPELTEEVVKNDHEFWTRYSERLIGNWITYDTPVRDIAGWAEKIYLRRNFEGFTGDPKFIRDDQAQKSFSKLRSSIAGVYNWRIAASKPGSPERQRMLKEADFAFRQAFALCPYSPEALFRYVNLLVSPEFQRFDDALLLVKTSLKLDPFNNSIQDLLTRLQEWKSQRSALDPSKMERQLRENPNDFQAALNLASEYFQLGQTGAALQALDQVLNSSNVPSGLLRSLISVYTTLSNETKLQKTTDLLTAEFQNNPTDLEAGIALAEGYRSLHQPQPALQVLGKVVNSPAADPEAILQVAQQLVVLGNYPMLEATLDKLTKVAPDSPEAWFDLAAMRSILGKSSESLQALRQALKLSAERRARDPKAKDLLAELQHDARFNAIRNLPEFRALTAGKQP